MPVAVVDVGKMGVAMRQRLMTMGMGVRFSPIPIEVVRVLMMRVVAVAMRMLERFVCVLVLVPFAQVQPDAEHHQRRRDPERDRW